MNCPNYNEISKYVAECSAMQELGIKYIPSIKRSGSPCHNCLKEQSGVPTAENLTPAMSDYIERNKEKMPLPLISEQAVPFVKSMVRWALHGGTSDTEYNYRLDICKTCELYDKDTDRCSACGCFISDGFLTPGKARVIENKEAISDCPLGKWSVLGTDVRTGAAFKKCGSCGG